MKNLFLVDGAAGTGKTDMLAYLQTKHSGPRGVCVVKKLTTRKHRQEEKQFGLTLDLEFVSKDQFKAAKAAGPFYGYSYATADYGFSKSRLDKALETHTNIFAIVRDRSTIQEVVRDYPSVRTIPVFIYTDRDEVAKRLRADGYDDKAIEFRRQRSVLAWDDYLKHFELYREVLVNNSSRNDFHRLIDSLLTKYGPSNERANVLAVSHRDRFLLIKPLVGFKTAIQDRLQNYDKNVFLMMKFRDNNKIVHKFIQTVLESAGLTCVRADDPAWNITNNAYNPLAVAYCCKYGIGLFDEPEDGNTYSPNVAYELGMMHTHGKQCLILKRDELPAVPFDLIKDLYHRYKKDLELEHIVREWVAAIVKHV